MERQSQRNGHTDSYRQIDREKERQTQRQTIDRKREKIRKYDKSERYVDRIKRVECSGIEITDPLLYLVSLSTISIVLVHFLEYTF